MNNREAIGYMLLACKRLGYSKEEARKLFGEMYREFDFKTEEEAEKMGFDWYDTLSEDKEKLTPRKRNATPRKITRLPKGYKPKEIKDLENLRDRMLAERKLKRGW